MSVETLLAACQWPDLGAPYAKALREAVQFILARVSDVRGILVSGTIVRGTPAATSDLDIYVIREKPERQRIQRFFNGVPSEIFVNPESRVPKYFEEEHKAGRPITAHMLATGFVILACDGSLDALRERAQAQLAALPEPDDERLTSIRYMAAARYEDATDVLDTDPVTALMIMGHAVLDMLHYRFWRANRYLPRDKDLLRELDALDAELGALARRFYGESGIPARIAAAAQIAERTIETHGFFEWESQPEAVE